jgi:hypothetical protein
MHPGYTVGPHSPDAKIRHDMRPALATTTRPDFAVATRWAKISGRRQAIGFSGAQTARYSSLSASSIRITPARSGLSLRERSRRVSHSHSKSRQTCGRSGYMAQPPARRQLAHKGPAGFLSSAISRAEQHIVHGPQALPGATDINQLQPAVQIPNRSPWPPLSSFGGREGIGERKRGFEAVRA